MFIKTTVFLILLVFLTSCGSKGKTSPDMVTPSTIGANRTLRLIQTISLPNVAGRIDHLSVDVQGQRLFVAALANNSIEVLDLKTGKLIHSISNVSEPQGVLFLPALNKLFVTNGGSGLCQVFDATSFAELSRVDLASDADNIRYDNSSGSVVVGHGNGGLSFIDSASGQEVTDIKLDGHPESFQLESAGSKLFVNIPPANEIAVVDRQQKSVVARWPIANATANYPMALDERQHRLFVGFRSPAKLNVYETETGNLILSLNTVGDVDDIFYDASHKLIFAIGGEDMLIYFLNRIRTIINS